MEILQTYEFVRPSRGQYAPVVKALLEDGAPIVKLTRGEDFPEHAKPNSIQGAISTQIRESSANTTGKRARTWWHDPDTHNILIVTLWKENEGPKRKRKPAREKATA